MLSAAPLQAPRCCCGRMPHCWQAHCCVSPLCLRFWHAGEAVRSASAGGCAHRRRSGGTAGAHLHRNGCVMGSAPVSACSVCTSRCMPPPLCISFLSPHPASAATSGIVRLSPRSGPEPESKLPGACTAGGHSPPNCNSPRPQRAQLGVSALGRVVTCCSQVCSMDSGVAECWHSSPH